MVSVSVFMHLINPPAGSQVRKSQEWPAQQHVRFISAGQELFLDDAVSKALGSVLHCIASQGPAVKLTTAGKTGHGQKGVQQSPAADWVSCWKQGAQIRGCNNVGWCYMCCARSERCSGINVGI
jgi:hypothetical protein